MTDSLSNKQIAAASRGALKELAQFQEIGCAYRRTVPKANVSGYFTSKQKRPWQYAIAIKNPAGNLTALAIAKCDNLSPLQ
jgi:hypothetical protein